MVRGIIPAARRGAGRAAAGLRCGRSHEEEPAIHPAESFRHCPRCGHGPGVAVDGPLLRCSACGFHFHFNPAVAAGVIVRDAAGRVLLLRRSHEPRRGAFGFPGGFVDEGETIEEAIAREAREETGLAVDDVAFLGGWPNVYSWRGVDYPVLDLFFTGRGRPGSEASAGHEVDEVVWSRPEDVDPSTLAFPTTRAAFARFLERRGAATPGGGDRRGRALHAVLVEPEIHWNTGNAGRTCLGAGAQLHLVEPLGFSLDEREVRRAGLDYWDRVKPRVWASWEAFEAALPQLGEPFLASPDAGRDVWDVRFPERSVLVFGRESVGFPAPLRERHRDRLVRLPMHDPALRSLNVSTCVGILLYEVLRQWREAGRLA